MRKIRLIPPLYPLHRRVEIAVLQVGEFLAQHLHQVAHAYRPAGAGRCLYLQRTHCLPRRRRGVAEACPVPKVGMVCQPVLKPKRGHGIVKNNAAIAKVEGFQYSIFKFQAAEVVAYCMALC